MATVPLTTPYSLKNAKLTIDVDDYEAAISQVQFNPSTQTGTWRGISGNVLTNTSIAEWSVTLGLAQDLDPLGLLRYLHENEGTKKSAVFTPVDGGPDITATLTIAPGSIGGTANADYATTTVTLAVDGKPAFTDPV